MALLSLTSDDKRRFRLPADTTALVRRGCSLNRWQTLARVKHQTPGSPPVAKRWTIYSQLSVVWHSMLGHPMSFRQILPRWDIYAQPKAWPRAPQQHLATVPDCPTNWPGNNGPFCDADAAIKGPSPAPSPRSFRRHAGREQERQRLSVGAIEVVARFRDFPRSLIVGDRLGYWQRRLLPATLVVVA